MRIYIAIYMLIVLVFLNSNQSLALENFVGVFLDPSDANWINSMSSNVSAYGGTSVNIVVDWKEVETKEGHIDTDFLRTVLTPILSKNLYCILRIYANKDGYGQSIPDWLKLKLSSGDIYNDYNPLPWSSSYQSYLQNFMVNLNAAFNANPDIKPDGFQIATGGEFGEQGLWNYFQPINVIRLQLEEAEKVSVSLHNRLSTNTNLIMMFESLNGTQTFGSVPEYAIQVGYKWLQSNTGFYQYSTESWGTNPLNMMKSFHASYPSIKFIAEDEKSYSYLSLGDRFNLMQQYETDYNFTFSGVILNPSDFIQANENTIRQIALHVNATPKPLIFPPFWIGTISPYYFQTLTDACDAAASRKDTVIRAKAIDLPAFDFNKDIFGALIGGYDNNFIDNQGVTSFMECLAVTNGSLAVENIIIK